MANPFVHLELNTPDLAKAKEFYAGLFVMKDACLCALAMGVK